jgi:hypothetical protein
MKKNMSSADRVIRLIIAAILVTLYATQVVTGTLSLVALVVAGILALTSVVNFCPLYRVLGLSTIGKKITAKH